MQDDDSDDFALPASEVATSQQQQAASDQQVLTSDIPTSQPASATDAPGKVY